MISELQALRSEVRDLKNELTEAQMQVGSATIGQLKEHNRRERKREVIPQQVEIAGQKSDSTPIKVETV